MGIFERLFFCLFFFILPCFRKYGVTWIKKFYIWVTWSTNYMQSHQNLDHKDVETCKSSHTQGRIYYEASASGPHHLGGPHQNFNAVSKVVFLLRKKSLKVNLL